MSNSFLKNNFLKIIIGIPLFLLTVSMILFSNSHIDDKRKVNPYLETLPLRYSKLLNNVKENDSAFFCLTVDNFALRELVILKSFPTYLETRTKFTIEIDQTNGTSPLFLNIENNAAIFNFEGKTYGIYRKALPLINVERLVVKQQNSRKKKKVWSRIIEKPFKLLGNDFQYKDIVGNRDLFEPNSYLPLFVETLKLYNISFLPYGYLQKSDKLFQAHKNLVEYVLENKKTIGVVENENQFWILINKKAVSLSSKIKFDGENSKLANELIEGFLNGENQFEEVFNVKKLADFLALKNIFSNSCDDKTYFLYNVESKLLEPFFVNFSCLGKMAKNVEKPKINDISFITTYASALDKVSEIEIYNDLIMDNKELKKEISFINSYDTKTIFDIDILNVNQRIIEKSLDASLLVSSEIISVDNKKMELTVSNTSIFPLTILSLNYNPKKEITPINPTNQLLSGHKDTLIIDLPRSFENLFVSKKSKKTGFKLYKHIYDLNISYKISGLGKEYFTSISPYQQKTEMVEEDLFRIKSTVENFDNIIINEKDKSISFTKKEITISRPLIIPKGFTFAVNSGTKIDIIDGGKIISHAPLNFKGTKKQPIEIFSSDKKGQGIIVLSEGKQSNLEHVTFDYLTNPNHGYWSVSGAVTFYESPVNLNYVTVSNNRCEDALNIVRTNFEMKNCALSNTQSDAFDGDFVTGTISASMFDNLGNDAIDISGSNIKIINVQISNAGDKGLSAGENSQMTINNVLITSSEIAVAGKDLSIVIIKDLEVSNTKLGFTAFQKKPEFGPSNISVSGLKMEGVEMDYLIENTSSLIVDGVKIETSQNVKDRMYGVEFGVSSKETQKSN